MRDRESPAPLRSEGVSEIRREMVAYWFPRRHLGAYWRFNALAVIREAQRRRGRTRAVTV